jgi:hypothetical protein
VKKKWFSGEQKIIGILRQAERGEQIIGEICRAHGVSEQPLRVSIQIQPVHQILVSRGIEGRLIVLELQTGPGSGSLSKLE